MLLLYSGYMDAFEPVLSQLPWLPVIGNHECAPVMKPTIRLDLNPALSDRMQLNAK